MRSPGPALRIDLAAGPGGGLAAGVGSARRDRSASSSAALVDLEGGLADRAVREPEAR